MEFALKRSLDFIPNWQDKSCCFAIKLLSPSTDRMSVKFLTDTRTFQSQAVIQAEVCDLLLHLGHLAFLLLLVLLHVGQLLLQFPQHARGWGVPVHLSRWRRGICCWGGGQLWTGHGVCLDLYWHRCLALLSKNKTVLKCYFCFFKLYLYEWKHQRLNMNAF